MAETILAVDDDIDILELVEASLTADGFNVITASDGRGALESAREYTPDLILLDLMMPEMDGFEGNRKAQIGCGNSYHPGHHAHSKGANP